jgi:hypothetical protein
MVLYVGRRYCGLPLRELGRATGVEDYRTVAVAIKRFPKRLERQPRSEMQQLRKLCEMSNAMQRG